MASKVTRYFYKNDLVTMEELKERIQGSFGRIRRRSVERAVAKIGRNIDRCIERNGNIFEYLENCEL